MADVYLYDRLMDYANSGVYPFHMPGHKLGRGLDSFPLLKLDLTEIREMDNLYEPNDVIAKAQELMAKTFGADESLFLVNGSTTGVISAILGVCNPKDELIIARNSHYSTYHGMILGDIIPRYINPQVIDEYGLLGGISPKNVQKAIEDYPKAKAVFITSPTYEGFTSNISEIARITHNSNKLLIVDEAHGAHFNFHSAFPKTALSCGADIVIQSLHKTLPALTQSALIHFKGNRFDKNRVKQIVKMIQTSSPSYILMGMMDLLRNYLDERKNNGFDTYIENLINLREKLNELTRIKLLGEELNNNYSIEEIDISRLVFYTGRSNKTGIDIDKILRDSYKIQMEMSSEVHFVGISTIVDSIEAFNSLYNALISIDKELMINEEKTDTYNIIYPISTIKSSPREAFYSIKKSLPLEDARGRISGESVVLYPPGIPILSPGEEITKIHIEQIARRIKQKRTIDVIG
ncbi:MAG: aminotransferase class I/II-fold pyridoxal phosphate-dependent enzyme [Epulopiscium sp.]|jgi:arginine/lysine/ornithine decarboxylase|nr:aminotransferase class I/II-fold pyridoxal phosphate-dependent enzyme [Candidatus Epulonipiscium sp.]